MLFSHLISTNGSPGRRPSRLDRMGLVAVLVVALAWMLACSDGNDSGGAGAAVGTGSVAVVMTDAPIDEFVQVLVRVTRIDLLGTEDTRRETIFEGDQTFDLLALQNVSEPFAIAEDVPAGVYSKLRLELAEIELVRMNGAGGFESIFPPLPGGNRIDLNPRGGFEVVPGGLLAIRLDLDARRSIQLVEGGNGVYRFRPQVFVEIMDVDLPGRLILVEGLVRTLEQAGDSTEIELCEVELRRRTDSAVFNRHCLTVFAASDVSIFDGSGLAVDLESIDPGDRLAVFGRFWIERDRDRDRLAVKAELIELGGTAAFLSLLGEVSGEYDAVTESLLVDLDPGQGFADPTALDVGIVPATRIFSKGGDVLEIADLVLGTRVEVDGVLVLSSGEPDLLRAAILFATPPIAGE